uniref:Exocyst subunit Exo70 family protein n=2 Tax=Quercus lobata TaxID=97700 RepID=A0A7N2M6X5_QUELO
MSRYSSPARNSISTGTPRRNFSESLIEQSIEAATVLINKWNPETSTYAKVTSLFHESKSEAMQFIRCVNDLQKSMHAMVTENSTSEKLVQAQNLMQIAMNRLQKEFYQILSMNRAHLDPESVSSQSSRASALSSISDYDDDGSVSHDDEVRNVGDSIDEVEEVSSIVMTDLRSTAECMISSGYAKECISIYKIIRKSIIDEGIYRLGVEKISSSQINKMDWEVLDRRIKDWLEAVKVSMTTLFNGERILCDHVFASSDSIRESCFTEISKGATLLFGFPELVAKSKKSHPEKIFRMLDMYTAISTNWIEIDSIFSFESTVTVRAQALNSLNKLSDSVRSMISEFESTLQKDSSKSTVTVHTLTLTTMNYLSLLADYSNILADIFANWPPPPRSSLPESYFESPSNDESPAPAISMRMAWLILVLLCKLDGKVEHHKDVCLSYIFLANNLNHVVSKVQTSNLKYLLGEDWIAKHEEKVKLFAANYERLAWGPVLATLPENPTATITPAQAKEIFRKFNSSFDETFRRQSSFVVSDPKLRDEMKVSLARKIVPSYREFYDAHRSNVVGERNVGLTVRFAPEDVGNYLSDLFFGNSNNSGSTSVSLFGVAHISLPG